MLRSDFSSLKCKCGFIVYIDWYLKVNPTSPQLEITAGREFNNNSLVE